MGLVVGPRLSAAGGVAITGIDLAKPLPAEPKARISEAFRDHHVVVFPGQALTRERQYEYARNFGEVERHGGRRSGDKRYAVAHVISNLDKDGNPVDRSFSPVSNYRWHTDKSYRAVPPLLTMTIWLPISKPYSALNMLVTTLYSLMPSTPSVLPVMEEGPVPFLVTVIAPSSM